MFVATPDAKIISEWKRYHDIRDINDIPQSYPFLAHFHGAIPRIMSHEFSANGFNCPSLGQLGPKGTCSPGSRNLKYRKITGYHMEKMR
jgi:hypothetical protein